MKPKTSLCKNKRMGQQFIKRHGALSNEFSVGQMVITRDFHGIKPTWNIGTITHRKGKAIYEVRVGEKIWAQHANQLQPTRQAWET